MKYITKEWAAAETNFQSPLLVSKEAGVFLEAYYKKLYAQKKKANLKSMYEAWLKDCAAADDGKIIPAFDPIQKTRDFGPPRITTCDT